MRHQEIIKQNQKNGKKQKKIRNLEKMTLYPYCYIVNSIIAFTISLLLFFRARTAFALDTFAWDMTSSMSFTSTPVSSTSSSSLSSCTVGVCVFYCMFEMASPWTLNFSAAVSCACWESFNLGFPKDEVGIWNWALVDIWLCDDKENILISRWWL